MSDMQGRQGYSDQAPSERLDRYRGGNICVRCGHQGEPLEPYFDLTLAAELIPMRASSLRVHLCRNRAHYPARYRLDGMRPRRRIRVLSAQEIKRIRAEVLRGPGKPE
jgi:hypothetical protein